MKKILALVLALVMVLGVASVMAEGSKQTPGGGGEGEDGIAVDFVEDTEVSEAIIDNFKFENLPENVKSKLPENYTKINEMVTAQFVGDVSEVADYTVMNFKFNTLYAADTTVMVLIGVLPATADGEVEWFDPLKGTVQEDGSINATLPKIIFDTIQNKPYILAVVSAAE